MRIQQLSEWQHLNCQIIEFVEDTQSTLQNESSATIGQVHYLFITEMNSTKLKIVS